MTNDPLFNPLKLGALNLSHRVVMAPLTRMRSMQPGNVPYDLNAEYYGQRASEGGLLITEATDINPQAHGYNSVPGIYTPEQIDGWKGVTAAVHAKGGMIVNQIWHVGRVSHTSLQPEGALPVSPSAIAAPGEIFTSEGQSVPFETPRALELAEIEAIKVDFVQAAMNARSAGFDGVEIHGANGYLIDQFLNDGSNKRTDHYGGPLENRARFLFEVVDAVGATIGSERIGVRLSPWSNILGMTDSDGVRLWEYVIRELGKRGIAYLHLIEPRADFTDDEKPLNMDAPDVAYLFKKAFGGPIISAGGFQPETARAAVLAGNSDAIAFGRPFIANPDLPERLRLEAPLNKHIRATFYGGGAEGYTDYPYMSRAAAE
ncbi:N-ethylmaleimide reductase [Pseudorhizobium tarimense]|uniref:N-ethylmaleimide reductase n=1 Tax=Pseudorhizobium tarimense TaxID=1079109 RepID=A0ABV2HBT5_9HYPH|nr:alkene reductase [Pseudorhizobium tarimense]MCJ8521086.1 alkene reductase [Pseudorhizobium tarimense]